MKFPIVTLVFAAGSLLLGSVAWFALVNAADGPMTHAGVLSGLGILIVSFAPLAAFGSWRRWSPLRIALGIAVAVSILDAMSMPAPPRPESVSSFVALVVILVLAVSAHLLVEQRPRHAFAALVGLAIFGVSFVYAVDYYATSSRFGPSAKYTAFPVAVVGAACLAACWFGRSLRRRVKVHPAAIARMRR